MAIELTPEEQATKRRITNLKVAIHHWKGSISNAALGLAVEKKGLTNQQSIRKQKRKERKKAQMIVNSFDKGFLF
jgi:hypothetical protein